MASPIITAIRQRRDLKESVLHTAQELAHRASIYGVVRASNAYMGGKCHCHGRTFQRHVVRLVEARILKKTVVKKVGQPPLPRPLWWTYRFQRESASSRSSVGRGSSWRRSRRASAARGPSGSRWR